MWRCLWVPKNFPVILPEKWWWKCWFGVGTVGEDEGIWEKCLCCAERKWKRKKTIEVSWPKSKEISEWVVGGGVRWGLARGNPNLILTFFFFNIMLTGTLHSSPLIKISSLKFYVPWSWKRLGYLDNISSSRSQDASFAEWFFHSTLTQGIVLLRNTLDHFRVKAFKTHG